MKAKNFFKPSIAKIIIFVILMAVTSIPSNILISGADIGINHGFPLNFYGYGGGPALQSGQPVPSYFYALNLIIDLRIWYIVSCAIIECCNKKKK